MKIVERADATQSLADYAADIDKGAVIVTDQGQPVAALVPIENADLETVSLSERSRARARAEGGISSEEMRRRFS